MGHGDHGKDEFGERLAAALSLRFCSSSMFACERVIFPWFLRHFPELYATPLECFKARREWRVLWHNLIARYNTPLKTRLANAVLEEHEIYIGMRCPLELGASTEGRLFRYYFWVDASERKPPESAGSNGITYDPSYMIRIGNNGTKDELQDRVNETAALMLNEYAGRRK